jgi:DNA repair exonuclease SbcCD ATPase subunit
MLSRAHFKDKKAMYLLDLLRGHSVTAVQSLYRGHVARSYYRSLRQLVSARHIQRVFRGHLARRAAQAERDRLALIIRKQESARVIQAAWRMKVAKEEFRSLRIHMLAAQEIQRCFRGFLGRKQVSRRRRWEAATPGPERIKLGLQLIDESKAAFERQQEEIDALHRAQERAEARVSHIHEELKDSEKELGVLERELQEIDQIERDLVTLTHERELLTHGVRDATGMPRGAQRGHEDLVMGRESTAQNDPDIERRRKAEAYALEMTIQIKRAEREKKRQELETEFASVFQEVEKKKKALERLELSLADMEATRERKDREFRRLQKNLMQLLLEQKQELDDLREKGIELETATAITAAAASATAQKAKEHEKRSAVMFSQTEELMKFQFMSMSLSYFSSLNMLKQMRDMNSDTTSAAIASSADAAASSAAAAAAANLPSVKKLQLGANDFVEMNIQKKKTELQASEAAEKETVKARSNPLPDSVRNWSVSDVCRWLDVLSLGQYAEKFREASVDGPFLMELREEDMVNVLEMRHKLHVRKILVSREKLKPLSEQELVQKDMVEGEVRASSTAPIRRYLFLLTWSLLFFSFFPPTAPRDAGPGRPETQRRRPGRVHCIQPGQERPHQTNRRIPQPR